MERVIGEFNNWISLQGNLASQVSLIETRLNIVIGLYNLKTLHRLGFMDRIPTRASKKSVEYRNITTQVEPTFSLGKRLILSKTPIHWQRFVQFCKGAHALASGVQASIPVPLDGSKSTPATRAKTVLIESRPTITRRGTALISAGFVLFVEVLEVFAGTWMIKFQISVSFMGVAYSVFFLLNKDRVMKKVCGCSQG